MRHCWAARSQNFYGFFIYVPFRGKSQVNRAKLSQTQPLPPSANHSTTERYAPYDPAFFAGVDSRDRNAFGQLRPGCVPDDTTAKPAK
jgi:hypothetical protein